MGGGGVNYKKFLCNLLSNYRYLDSFKITSMHQSYLYLYKRFCAFNINALTVFVETICYIKFNRTNMVAAKKVMLLSDTLYTCTVYAMAAIGCREVYMYRNMLIQKKKCHAVHS